MYISHYDSRIRVETQGFSLEIADTASNRKVLVIVLREVRDSDGRRLFTFEELAGILESSNRQASEQYYCRFKEHGEDLLRTLERTRKVDGEVVDAVRGELVGTPLAPVSELRVRVCTRLGREDLSCANIDAALDQISSSTLRRILRGQLAAGEAHYQEEYLIRELFALLSAAGSPEVVPCLEGSEDLGASFEESIPALGAVPPELKDSDMQAVEQLFEAQEQVTAEGLHTLWYGELGWHVLLFLLYFWGIPQRVLGNWFGVSASTVCRRLADVALWGRVWFSQQRLAFSGSVDVDEKMVWIGGRWWYLFAAVDSITRCVLHSAFSPSNTRLACAAFLMGLKLKGYLPKVIITDGWDGYIQAIKHVFPEAEHLLCRFHLLRSVFRRLRKARGYAHDVWQQVGSLFHTSDKRTVRRRVSKLEKTVAQLGVRHVLSGLLAKLPQVLPAVGSTWRPSTSNGVERFFRLFDRLYELKGPFQDLASAQKHLALVWVGYMFAVGRKGQACPLQRAGIDVGKLPFYHLWNRPNLLLLRERMGDVWRQVA